MSHKILVDLEMSFGESVIVYGGLCTVDILQTKSQSHNSLGLGGQYRQIPKDNFWKKVYHAHMSKKNYEFQSPSRP